MLLTPTYANATLRNDSLIGCIHAQRALLVVSMNVFLKVLTRIFLFWTISLQWTSPKLKKLSWENLSLKFPLKTVLLFTLRVGVSERNIVLLKIGRIKMIGKLSPVVIDQDKSFSRSSPRAVVGWEFIQVEIFEGGD